MTITAPETRPDGTTYPDRIRLSSAAESFIAQLATDLALGKLEPHQLSPALADYHWSAFFTGYNLRQAEIDRINFDRDRLWMAAFNPAHRIDPNRPTFAELERRRGNPEHASQIEADMAILFGQVNG